MDPVDSLPRSIEPRVRRAAREMPVVTIVGPRQSGMSTLCRRVFRGKPYVNLEAPDVRSEALRDPRAFLGRYPKGAVLDEIQRAPDLVSYLQGLVDEDPAPGRWILTGSQHLTLSKSVAQSLAGRTAVLQLLPLSQAEASAFPLRPGDVWTEVARGGYPRIRARKLDAAGWFEAYVATYLERDVRDIRQVGDLAAFQTVMRLLAGRTASLLNLTSLGNDAGIAQNSARAWISVLEATYVIARLQPLLPNVRKRLVKTPKVHFIDSGLAAWLLGIRSAEQLDHHPLRGSLFESWVHAEVMKLRLNTGSIADVAFYRDQHGLEADLVVDAIDRLFVVEVKSGRTVASDWFAPLQRVAEALRQAKVLTAGREVIPMVVYAGDRSSTQAGVRLVAWHEVESAFRKR
jgi:predicted AAA+ superfamily ATPase